MKTKRKLLFTGFLCLFFMGSYAQTSSLSCTDNVQNAVYYLEGTVYPKDTQKAIDLLNPCIANNNSHALLLMGRILLQKNDSKAQEEGFTFIKKAAKLGNTIAMTDLATLYKYGTGCQLNYNKAQKWYKKAAELGNDKAAYALGYLYLKGLGTTPQDYKKAIYWFEKSSYAMASYWLAVCHYYGYGVQQSNAKATNFLTTNFATPTPANTLKEKHVSLAYNELDSLKQASVFEPKIQEKALNGNWKGTLLLMDWSTTYIEHKVPFEITASTDKNGVLSANLTIDQIDYKANATYLNNELSFTNFTVTLPHTSLVKQIPSSLSHEVTGLSFTLKDANHTTYLTGTMATYVPQWKEEGVPMRFVLTKQPIEPTALSDEALVALSTQTEHFIKLYPNPFINDLIVAYHLPTAQNVTVYIHATTGVKKQVILDKTLLPAGEHTHFFSGANLPKGMYIVTVQTAQEKHTRILVKK